MLLADSLSIAPRVIPSSTRSVITIPVHNKRVDVAIRKLNRTLKEENIGKKWSKSEFYMKPCQERKLGDMETELRLKRREFRKKMRWIMRRKERGF